MRENALIKPGRKEGNAKMDLIKSLETVKLHYSGCAVDDMLTKEYESALKRAGFNPKSICQIKDGRYKISSPIQVCRKKRIDVLKELYVHYYGIGSTYTLRDVFQLATTEYRKLVDNGHREENTYDHYICAWNRFINKSVLADMKMTAIKRRDLLNFYSDMTAPDENGKRITRSTLRNVITTINLCFDYSLDFDIIEHNVAMNIKTDKLICGEGKSHEAYTAYEVERLREVLKDQDSPYARIIRLDLCLVARIGELEALKWHDVDLVQKTVHIHSQIVRRKRNGRATFEYVPYTKTGRHSERDLGRRILKLNSKAIEVLKEQRLRNPFGEFVFISEAGTPLITSRVNDHLKKYCKMAGVPYLSTHSIRTTNITKLFDMNVAPTKIQMAAGHTDIRTTNGYCHAEKCDEIDEEILEKAL